MTHHPASVPPPDQWPILTGPDCLDCQTPDHTRWSGPATSLDTGGPVHLWQCLACCAEWAIPITHWPVLAGPDCPVCDTPHTCWATYAPDDRGDLWTCANGHEFVLTPDGLVFLPGGGSA